MLWLLGRALGLIEGRFRAGPYKDYGPSLGCPYINDDN